MLDVHSASSEPRVDLSLSLREIPESAARELRALQAQDPEELARLILVGLSHRAVFQSLYSALPSR